MDTVSTFHASNFTEFWNSANGSIKRSILWTWRLFCHVTPKHRYRISVFAYGAFDSRWLFVFHRNLPLFQLEFKRHSKLSKALQSAKILIKKIGPSSLILLEESRRIPRRWKISTFKIIISSYDLNNCRFVRFLRMRVSLNGTEGFTKIAEYENWTEQCYVLLKVSELKLSIFKVLEFENRRTVLFSLKPVPTNDFFSWLIGTSYEILNSTAIKR